MNIFYTDNNPYKAACYQCDKHVVKMILESAQMLCTAHRVLDDSSEHAHLYRATHKNHPSNLWVRESISNYDWLFTHFTSLCKEYTKRYNKVHLCERKLLGILNIPPFNIPDVDMTPIKLAMPDNYKSENPVESYRNYYMSKQNKMSMVWTKTQPPKWFKFNVE